MYVYFLQSPDGLIKIGRASNLKERASNLQVAYPDPLVLRAYLWTDKDRALERELHQRFAQERVRGEWFRCSPRLENYMRILKETIRF